MTGDAEPVERVSVVIPALNAAATLPRTLRAVRDQHRPPSTDVEVVVVDDGSTDGTPEAARRVDPAAIVIGGEHVGPSAARNRGAAAATGDVLVFLDSDDVPLEGWLEQMVALLADPSVGLASWPALIVEPVHRTRLTWRPDRLAPDGLLALSGCFAVRRALFEDVGGYDPALRFGENTDLGDRLLRRLGTTELTVAHGTITTMELHFANPAADYDERRLAAMEHLLRRDAETYAADAPGRAKAHAIAAVNAARTEQWRRARHHALASARARPTDPRAALRLVATAIPPVGRQLWNRPARRRRIDTA